MQIVAFHISFDIARSSKWINAQPLVITLYSITLLSQSSIGRNLIEDSKFELYCLLCGVELIGV